MTNCRTTPLIHQVSGSQLMVDTPVFALFDDMGTGKSKTTIDAVCDLALQGIVNAAVVVCPNTVKSNWTDPDPEKGEISKHGWNGLDHSVYELFAGEKLYPMNKLVKCHVQWVVINYESVWRDKIFSWLKQFMATYRVAMILDESHNIKNPGTSQTKGCIKLGQLAKRRYILSGTPVTKNPLDLYSQFRFLDWQILGYTTFSAYKNDIVIYDPYGFKVNGRPVGIKEYKNIDMILKKISPFYRRVLKRDCLDLPDKVRMKREIPLSKEQIVLYNQMKSKLIAEYQGQKVKATIALTKFLRLSQICSGYLRSHDEDLNPVITYLDSPKVKECVSLIDNHEGSSIVFFQERAECEMLGHALTAKGIGYFELHGGVPIKARKALLEAFKAKEKPVILCQQRTGGIGVDLTAADLVIFFSNTDDHGARAQAEDRAHRYGQHKPVTYIDLLSTLNGCRTVDHKILDSVHNKESFSQMVIKTDEELKAFFDSL